MNIETLEKSRAAIEQAQRRLAESLAEVTELIDVAVDDVANKVLTIEPLEELWKLTDYDICSATVSVWNTDSYGMYEKADANGGVYHSVNESNGYTALIDRIEGVQLACKCLGYKSIMMRVVVTTVISKGMAPLGQPETSIRYFEGEVKP